MSADASLVPAKDAEPDEPDVEDTPLLQLTKKVERLEAEAAEARLRTELLDQAVGVPKPGASAADRMRLLVMGQVSSKLARFGPTRGTIIASLVLLCNLIFIWVFVTSKTSQCEQRTTVMDPSPPVPDAFSNMFIGNTHVCSSSVDATLAFDARDTCESAGIFMGKNGVCDVDACAPGTDCTDCPDDAACEPCTSARMGTESAYGCADSCACEQDDFCCSRWDASCSLCEAGFDTTDPAQLLSTIREQVGSVVLTLRAGTCAPASTGNTCQAERFSDLKWLTREPSCDDARRMCGDSAQWADSGSDLSQYCIHDSGCTVGVSATDRAGVYEVGSAFGSEAREEVFTKTNDESVSFPLSPIRVGDNIYDPPIQTAPEILESCMGVIDSFCSNPNSDAPGGGIWPELNYGESCPYWFSQPDGNGGSFFHEHHLYTWVSDTAIGSQPESCTASTDVVGDCVIVVGSPVGAAGTCVASAGSSATCTYVPAVSTQYERMCDAVDAATTRAAICNECATQPKQVFRHCDEGGNYGNPAGSPGVCDAYPGDDGSYSTLSFVQNGGIPSLGGCNPGTDCKDCPADPACSEYHRLRHDSCHRFAEWVPSGAAIAGGITIIQATPLYRDGVCQVDAGECPAGTDCSDCPGDTVCPGVGEERPGTACHLQGMTCDQYVEPDSTVGGHCGLPESMTPCDPADCSTISAKSVMASVMYVVCPDVSTVLGAAMGYVFVVEMAAVAVTVTAAVLLTGGSLSSAWDQTRSILRSELATEAAEAATLREEEKQLGSPSPNEAGAEQDVAARP
jgi:hypothetical protein